MTKVLIISYFFPPANFVGGERTYSWAKHLYESGIYPIIVTRQWNENQKDLIDEVSNNVYTVEETEQYKIIRLPYKRSLRDRCSNSTILKPLRKLLTLKELIRSNYSIAALPYSNFYNEVRKELESDSSIKAVIASGRPFQSFSIGHQIKKEFDVLWIPDYRDEWTTHQNLGSLGIVQRYLQKRARKSELKWTSNADFFITVSETWAASISSLINKKGETIYNGFEELQHVTAHVEPQKPLQITYAGTLYPSQNIDVFINACLELLKGNNSCIQVQFIGANVIQEEEDKIRKQVTGYEEAFSFSDRIPKDELQGIIAKTDLLYLSGFTGVKGWYPVKLFEYFAADKPILLCPGDHNVMHDFVQKSNSGYVANTSKECQDVLSSLIQQKSEGKPISCERNLTFGSTFSRKNQAAKLAELIKHKIQP